MTSADLATGIIRKKIDIQSEDYGGPPHPMLDHRAPSILLMSYSKII